MSTFRRSLRWFFAIAGFGLGLATAVSAYIARTMVAPARQNLWATPQKKGLTFETVQFPAQASDGIRDLRHVQGEAALYQLSLSLF